MKKGIALLTAVGMLASMITPVLAEEQIITYKGDQEIVLTEAGDTDLTMEELVKKVQSVMQESEDLALFMTMDVDASISADINGTPMSMDMIMKADMSRIKNNGIEYETSKMTMSFFGMNMDEVSEEYIFDNADGLKVSVKKTSGSAAEESSDEWTASAAEESEEGADEEEAGIDSYLSDDLYSTCELLDKIYTDGEQNYYVLKADTSKVMDEAFSDVGEMFGGINADQDCYLLIGEDGRLESLYMDLGEIPAVSSEEIGGEISFSNFLISMYTEPSSEIVIPDEVQAAGDAVA